MKISLALAFAAAIGLSLPAVAQVRPFSQLTAQTLEAGPADCARTADGPRIDIGLILGPDEDRKGDQSGERAPSRGGDNRRQQDSTGLGAFGGFGFGYFLPALNGFEGLTDDRGLHASAPALDTWAGRGFISWNGFRFGGVGSFGSYHLSDTVSGDDRTANLRVGYGGITFDYLMPLGSDRVGLTLGGAMGGGGTWISASGQDLGSDKYWAEFTGFRFFAPEVGVSVLAIPWVRVEFTAQYMFMDVNLQGHAFVSDKGERLIDTNWLGGPIFTMWFLFGHD